MHYPKPERRFIKAIGIEDVVTSEYLFKTTDGRELKLDDYIKQFEKFVKDNPEHIEALKVVLEKPTSWNTKTLKELREKLSQTPERFTDDNLRKAYKYPLADIISMIKHAAKEEPLISGKERVDLAITKVIDGKSFTPQQQEWLKLIKKHLVENLTIEPADFDSMPIFTNYGGSFNRINKDFDNDLMMYISQINSAMPQVYAYAN
jgi:type I restriction enzyme R subunit